MNDVAPVLVRVRLDADDEHAVDDVLTRGAELRERAELAGSDASARLRFEREAVELAAELRVVLVRAARRCGHRGAVARVDLLRLRREARLGWAARRRAAGLDRVRSLL